MASIPTSSPSRPSLRQRIASANRNPLIRVEQLKRRFVLTQLPKLRSEIYSALITAGYSRAYALTEIDRALVEIAKAVAAASADASKLAVAADVERLRSMEDK